MTRVAGRTAFITGGGSGVALGQAKIFAQAGCKVAIADIRQDHLDEAMAWFDQTDFEVMPIKLDITDRAAYAAAADAVFGHLHLGAFTTVYEKEMLVERHHLRSRVTVKSR